MDGSKSISSQSRRGIGWLTLSQVIRPLWEFIVGIVMARMLMPNDFGIVAMGTMFYGLIYTFSSFGIGQFLVQVKIIDKNLIATAQAMSVLIGIMFLILCLLVSTYVGDFFGESAAGIVFRIFSINLLVGSLLIVPNALLSRDMRFKEIALIEIFSSLVYGGLCLLFVSNGFGLWSLVYPVICSTITSLLISCYFLKYSPLFRFDRNCVVQISKFGYRITASSILNYLARNADYIIIGKILGSHGLGIYKRGYDLAVLPKEKISDSIGKVYYSSIRKIRDDNGLMRLFYINTTKAIAFISIPILFGFVLVSHELVLSFYGENWLEATVPLQLLSIGGIFYCLTIPNSQVLVSLGKLKIYLTIQIVYFCMLFVSVLFLIQYGIVGVSVAVTFVLFIVWILSVVIVKKFIDINLFEIIAELSKILLSNFIMFLVVMMLDYFLAGSSEQIKLIVKSIVGALIYSMCLIITKEKIATEALTIISRRFRLFN